MSDESSAISASYGQVTVTCPCCNRRVPLWIIRSDTQIDAHRGGLTSVVESAGPHSCSSVAS